MKTNILAILVFGVLGTGCLQSMHQSINNAANNRRFALDAECKANMTEWCQSQYELLEQQRINDINEATARHQAAMQSISDGFKRPPRRTFECRNYFNRVRCEER